MSLNISCTIARCPPTATVHTDGYKSIQGDSEQSIGRPTEMIDRREREVSEMYQPAGSQAMGNVRGVLGNLSNFGQTALPLQRHSMTSMLGHRVRMGGRAIRWPCQRSL